MRIEIDYDKCCWKNGKCTSCSCKGGCENSCTEICPVGALKKEKRLIVNHKKCIACGVCVNFCKHHALSLK